MDALRSEIADELTKKSLDKNRIMGLFSKMLDVIETLPKEGGSAGGRGPKGEPGARGPMGPAGPAGPAGKCECKCVSAAAPAPTPAPAAAPAAEAPKKTVRKKKVVAE